MSDNVTTPAGQTTIVDTDRRNHDGGCHSSGFSVQPTMDLCGRGHHGHNRDGDFHILSGQHRESVQIGSEGRFSDASSARLLKAITDLGERSADRLQAFALASLKEASDTKMAVVVAQAANTKETLEAKFQLADKVCDAKTTLLAAIAESRLDCERTKHEVSEKFCTLRKEMGEGFAAVLKDADRREELRDKFRILALETRDHHK